jgi:hypothetical protein
MSAHLGVTIGFMILCGYELMLFRWWYRRLVVLASRYDIAQRRKRASREVLIVGPLVYIPAVVVVIGSIIHRSVSGIFIVVVLLFALAPTFIWYGRQLPKLRALGYYEGQK